MKKQKELGVKDFTKAGMAIGAGLGIAGSLGSKNPGEMVMAGATGAIGGAMAGAALGFLAKTGKRAYGSITAKPKKKGSLLDLY
jgi:hypothetical protein